MNTSGGLNKLAAALQTAVIKAKKGRAAVRGIVSGDSVQVGNRYYKTKSLTKISFAPCKGKFRKRFTITNV